jgi:hypothetical protein
LFRTRQTAKIETLSSERFKETDEKKTLTLELEQACRYTDAETTRADNAIALVKQLEEERQRKDTEIESVSQMVADQKQRLEMLMEQSDNSSGKKMKSVFFFQFNFDFSERTCCAVAK